eukprot:CAMPEP_0118650536 /NCGR_PEP_ID=MMETSP0785-20121206/10299_1 /TAXON_ID=91992 /ORGANISM="Bolidomonas pacifica, Strain CCMP 1866" /LENGTH=256 /DNA_ID=CAMNT_0006542917 /DNA_START=82 /DNA_END=852 /DNA_ORIENTATION=-
MWEGVRGRGRGEEDVAAREDGGEAGREAGGKAAQEKERRMRGMMEAERFADSLTLQTSPQPNLAGQFFAQPPHVQQVQQHLPPHLLELQYQQNVLVMQQQELERQRLELQAVVERGIEGSGIPPEGLHPSPHIPGAAYGEGFGLGPPGAGFGPNAPGAGFSVGGVGYLAPLPPPAAAFPSLESPRLQRQGTGGSIASQLSYGPRSEELNALVEQADVEGIGEMSEVVGDPHETAAVQYEPERRMVGRDSPTREMHE